MDRITRRVGQANAAGSKRTLLVAVMALVAISIAAMPGTAGAKSIKAPGARTS